MNIYCATNLRGQAQAAFSLIEMIGVMAIMAILAAIITPNLLHSIERTAVKAEADNLHALGGEIALYLRDNAAMPTTTVPPTLPNWTSQLATYSSLSAADILTNKRQMIRLYVPDPVAANQRALLLSSMRTGINLPTTAQVSANFQTIWNTVDGQVPVAAGWGAWGAGPAPALDNVEYLVIERVNLTAVYRTDLQALTITLNNKTPIAAAPPAPAVPATNASYRITLANGTVQAVQPVNSTVTTTLNNMHARDRIDLYRAAGILDSSYVLSTNSKSFDFNGTNWIPQ
jgi:prepilin-type N-terminal cleavage/methylation domain-containing protein